MKTRKGFVSNSSSSSFIIIDGDANPMYRPMFEGKVVTVGNNGGETDFGWQQEEYNDFESKANWALLMARYFGGESLLLWEYMLAKVIKDVTGASDVVLDLAEDAYIDHQSVEMSNATMFEDEETMKRWLFSPQSYIRNDNDNH